jgi:hypothetical protein
MWYCLSDEDYWVNKYYKYNSGEKDPRPGDGMEDDDEALFDDEGEAVIRGANKGGIVCEIAQIEKSEEEKHDARNSKSICDSTQIDLSENTNVRTDINTYINTSSESEKPDFVEKEEEEALNKKEAEEGAEIELKEALLRLSASFVFSPDFYGKALSFMREKGVNNRYLSWIYEQCVKAKPRSIRNYFYKSFFLPDFL